MTKPWIRFESLFFLFVNNIHNPIKAVKIAAFSLIKKLDKIKIHKYKYLLFLKYSKADKKTGINKWSSLKSKLSAALNGWYKRKHDKIKYLVDFAIWNASHSFDIIKRSSATNITVNKNKA